MRWRRAVVAAGLAWVWGGAAAAAEIGDFQGEWRGVALQTSGEDDAVALTPEDLDVQIREDGAGFHMSWTSFVRQQEGLARQSAQARFLPTDRPGVFAFDPAERSLLSRLFADPATGNPLAGQTLLWARLDGATLTIYSLAIHPDGGFDLDRYARTLTGDGMSARYTRRIENDVLLTIEGRLEAAGG